MSVVEPHFSRRLTNGIALNVAEAGPDDGRAVVLLHGFPEFWYGWRHQIPALVGAGFRVVAPDQRGYNASDKPIGVSSYSIDALVADVIGLLDGMGLGRVSLIGHDWGGIVAWSALIKHPDRFDRAVILNAPHPEAMRRALKEDHRQRLRSWYAFSFQIPWLPEKLLSRGDFRELSRGLERSSRPGTFSPIDLQLYKAAWGQPGALRSMIHWYRAALRAGLEPIPDPLVRIPTLILWGARDRFIGPGLARSSYALCESARLEWFEGATHWVQLEESARVNQCILDFLA